MSTTTSNLGLFKYDTSTDSHLAFNINTALNENWDIIDNFAKSQTVPIATTQTAGIVKPDGTTITVQADGTISSVISNVSNCITEIPQDIILELNNGTLTLKAGSKVRIPNGFEVDGVTPKFDTVTIANDLITTDEYSRNLWMCVAPNGNTLYKGVGSETGTPIADTYKLYYDPSANMCYLNVGGASSIRVSLPICIATSDSSGIIGLPNIFNGLGFIGSTVFVLPGVKTLRPYLRNADGTLRSVKSTISTVLMKQVQSGANDYYLMFDGTDIYLPAKNTVNYDVSNCWYNNSNVPLYWVSLGEFSCDVGNTVTAFKPKTVFHAVDYNDIWTKQDAIRNIGEIVTSTIPLTDAGLHLLDGGWIELNGSYREFVEYILSLYSSYPNLFVTETDYNNAINTYGVCGKFYYDGVNQRLRLPKINGFIEGTTDLTALSNLVEAGLPNITGTTNAISSFMSNSTPSGAFDYTRTQTGQWWQDNNNDNGYLSFDASRSSSIYGNSTTVQPQAIKVLYYIVIATTTKTDIQVDIDEIATDLNSKADVDLANCTKPHIVETYSNGTSWYRVYSDGWCEQGGELQTNVTFLKNFVDTNYVITLGQSGSSSSASVGRSTWLIKNTSGFTAHAETPTNWQACGYIS